MDILKESEWPLLKIVPYYSVPIDEIPLDYLIWIFPKLKRFLKDLYTFTNILEYFLTKSITVVDQTDEDSAYCFYFNDHKIYEPGSGEEISFMKSEWKGTDSNGETIYEIDHVNTKIYIHQMNEKWAICNDIIYHNYYYGGEPMIYQKNSNYYFYDGFGKIISGAYLIRKPWIPDASIADNFSENIKI